MSKITYKWNEWLMDRLLKTYSCSINPQICFTKFSNFSKENKNDNIYNKFVENEYDFSSKSWCESLGGVLNKSNVCPLKDIKFQCIIPGRYDSEIVSMNMYSKSKNDIKNSKDYCEERGGV